MKILKHVLVGVSALTLLSCGGGGSDAVAPPTPPSANVSIAPLNITIDGKQFGELAASERVNISYNREVVSIVSMRIKGDAEFEGRNIFSVSSDSSNTFADVRVDNSDIEGGTYMDELILTPSLISGPNLSDVIVNLTLVQEPTQALTAEINDPDDLNIEITEDGPPVRIAASVNTGPTIRWEVQPLRYIADDVDVMTTDPTQGVGSEQIEIVITPTETLVADIRANGPNFTVIAGLQDLDHPGNFTEFDVQVSLID